MQEGQTFTAGQGFTVFLAGDPSAWICPKATIRICASGNIPTLPDGDPKALVVGLSIGRARTLLGHGSSANAVFSRSSPDGVICLTVEEPGLVRRIAEELRSAPYSDANFHLYLQSRVMELLVAGISRQPSGTDPEKIARAIRDLLLTDPVNPPSLQDISRTLKMPAHRLKCQFQQVFGMSIAAWLREWRLQRAHDLLAEGGMSITEIALSLGYSHDTSFGRIFTRRFGAPPGAVRKNFTASTSPIQETVPPVERANVMETSL